MTTAIAPPQEAADVAKRCLIVGCDQRARSRGMCGRCYNREYARRRRRVKPALDDPLREALKDLTGDLPLTGIRGLPRTQRELAERVAWLNDEGIPVYEIADELDQPFAEIRDLIAAATDCPAAVR